VGSVRNRIPQISMTAVGPPTYVIVMADEVVIGVGIGIVGSSSLTVACVAAPSLCPCVPRAPAIVRVRPCGNDRVTTAR
jgi:hypothetical protein